MKWRRKRRPISSKLIAIDCPHKVKQFLCKTCSNILPIQRNWQKRRVCANGRYSICGEEEMVEHTLLQCNWCRGMWFVVLGIGIDNMRISSFDRWLNELFGMKGVRKDEQKIFQMKVAYTAWVI